MDDDGDDDGDDGDDGEEKGQVVGWVLLTLFGSSFSRQKVFLPGTSDIRFVPFCTPLVLVLVLVLALALVLVLPPRSHIFSQWYFSSHSEKNTPKTTLAH